MRVVLGVVCTVAVGAALFGWLGDPHDAAVLAFFTYWAILLLAVGTRPVRDVQDDGTHAERDGTRAESGRTSVGGVGGVGGVGASLGGVGIGVEGGGPDGTGVADQLQDDVRESV